MIVERKDGSLWMLARTKNGIMQIDVDRWRKDLGRADRAPRHSTTQRTVPHSATRFGPAVAGQAWRRDRLARRPGACSPPGSPTMTESPGRGAWCSTSAKASPIPTAFKRRMERIYISYDRNRATDGEILLARIHRGRHPGPQARRGKVETEDADLPSARSRCGATEVVNSLESRT